ncbi:hypothetical protein GE061_010518 [Apolygus lucorum]|uniref:Uncharacterized protein n=1 Tax=Apolygus lucorum TaxID=248454 RepID=A0A6A4IUP2_APOLU|nr:hypothetical protein GE061_010518 [Apolygus lucorum]
MEVLDSHPLLLLEINDQDLDDFEVIDVDPNWRVVRRRPSQNSSQDDLLRSGGGTMNCGTCFAKYLLCLFNFVLFFAGGLVLGVGVWLYFDKDSLLSIIYAINESAAPHLSLFTQPGMVVNIAYILMAAGGFVFIMSMLGYCGALRESKCLLGFYGFLLIVILILEITAVSLAFVYKDRAEGEVKNFLKTTIKDYYVTSDYSHPENIKGTTAVWDGIMVKMSCCGVNNYTDFVQSANFTQSGLKVPPSCCRMVNNTSLLDNNCPRDPKQENSYFLTGCYSTLVNRIGEHMNIVIYCTIGVILVELLTTFLAFCLCKTIEPYEK